MWFPNRSDKNRPVQLKKLARILKFWIYVQEELYYPSSGNKGADQLRGNREANLRLCFRLCRLLVFPWGGSLLGFDISHAFSSIRSVFIIFNGFHHQNEDTGDKLTIVSIVQNDRQHLAH